MTKIRIYYHVTCIGRYFEITKGIFDSIMESGLHDECEGIYVGVLGLGTDVEKLNELLLNYPKAKIIAHSTHLDYFELFTIQHLKKDADTLPKFFALYLHSKGVTSANENDSKFRQFWCDYMIYWMVSNWRLWYHALNLKDLDDHDAGYDIASVRVVSARKSIGHTVHGSGNMWSADSEYIKTLEFVLADTYFDGQNPYQGGHIAETWAFSGQPIIYAPTMMFQMGFPYDKGTFKEYWEALPNKEKYVL